MRTPKPVATVLAIGVGIATLVAAPSPAGAYVGTGGVVAITNEIRARAGCGPVVPNARLNIAAYRHSLDMAHRGYFAHTAPNGANPGRRVAAAGYSWSAYGENIAWGQPDAQTVMNDWMNSPSHRHNILNCGFRNIGVGLAYDADGMPYWTQDFARPR